MVARRQVAVVELYSDMGSARVSLEPPAPPSGGGDLFGLGSDAASYGILAALVVLTVCVSGLTLFVLWYRKALASKWELASRGDHIPFLHQIEVRGTDMI